jgi:hypothetical protein
MGIYTVTCHTTGCENAGHEISMEFLDETGPPDAVICGVCGQPITTAEPR